MLYWLRERLRNREAAGDSLGYGVAHPLNAPGPFYVADACCLSCGVPFAVAPDHFAWAEAGDPSPDQCYVRRQPETAAEVGRMIEVLRQQELGCIRYRGSDAAVLETLGRLGLQEHVEGPQPP